MATGRYHGAGDVGEAVNVVLYLIQAAVWEQRFLGSEYSTTPSFFQRNNKYSV